MDQKVTQGVIKSLEVEADANLLALNDALCAGKLKKGQLVLLASVGAGFTVGAVLLRWGF